MRWLELRLDFDTILGVALANDVMTSQWPVSGTILSHTIFTRATPCVSAVFAVVAWMSGWRSHAGSSVSKRIKISSNFRLGLVARHCGFPIMPHMVAKFLREREGAYHSGGFEIFGLKTLSNGVLESKRVKRPLIVIVAR